MMIIGAKLIKKKGTKKVDDGDDDDDDEVEGEVDKH